MRTYVLCHWGATHLSHTSKSETFHRRFQKRTVNRFITVAEANDIMPLPLPTNPAVMRYANDISKVAYRRKTSPYDAFAMVRQLGVLCLKDLLIIYQHWHSESSEVTQSFSTRSAMSTGQSPHLRDYTAIHCYLDNDVAGKTALGQLTEQLEISVIDRSTLYSGYNDLNEYLTTNFTNNLRLQL